MPSGDEKSSKPAPRRPRLRLKIKTSLSTNIIIGMALGIAAGLFSFFGEFDILMSSLPLSVENLAEMSFADSHLDVTVAVLVPDHRRDAFADREAIRAMPDLRLAVSRDARISRELENALPHATVLEIDSVKDYLLGEVDADACFTSAEAGSAWSLIYPQFAVAVVKPNPTRIPLAYAVARDQPEFTEFLSRWLKLKQKAGTLRRLYDYWILGKDTVPKKPRWSILRDVLGVGR